MKTPPLFTRPFITGFILLLVSLYSPAQTLNFKQFKTSDGLPSSVAYNVFEDSYGYVWVSTMMGLVKHNGRGFVPACTNLPVSEQAAYSIAEGPDRHIYIGANRNCIYKIQNDSAICLKSTEVPKPSMSGIIVQMAFEKNGDIFYSTYSHSYHYIKKQDKVVMIGGNDTTKPDQVNFRKTGDVYLQIRSHFGAQKPAMPFALIYLNGKNAPLKVPHLSVFSRVAYHRIKGYDYFSDGKTVFKMRNGVVLNERKVQGYLNMRPDPVGNLWVLSTNGALVLGPDLDSVATYLPGRLVNCVCFDRSGGIWVTTLGQGVYYCRNMHEKNFYDKNADNRITQLSHSRNKLFYYTALGDLYEVEGFSTKKLYHFDQPMQVTGVVENADDYMIATKTVLLLLSKKDGSIRELPDEENRPFGMHGLAEFSGDTLITKSGTSLAMIHQNKVIRRFISNRILYMVIPYDKNWFYVSTREGLWKLDWLQNKISPIDTINFYESAITQGFVNDDGNMWLGTEVSGILVRDPAGKVTRLKNLPFVSVPILDIYENMLIVSTNMGVFKADIGRKQLPSEWINLSQSPARGMAIIGNILWVANEEGLLSFNLDQFKDRYDYPINISGVWSNGKQVPSEQELFHYNESNLRFSFDFLNYKRPVNGFYFELTGPENMKGNIKGTDLQFQQLKPGNYVLKVFPMQGDTYDKKFFLAKNFTIQPAYWQTAWFMILMVLLMISFTAFVVAFFYNRKRKKEAQVAEMNNLLTEHKLIALKAQINPHFISNSLSAIQALIDSGNVVKANQYIAKFSLLIRYVLDYSDKSVSRLSDELDIIRLNVELEQLRFVNDFDFTIEIDPDVDIYGLHIPPLITQPFIENAIWHGLLPLKNIRPVRLLLKVSETRDFIVIEITDNGVGRQKTASGTFIANNVRVSKGTQLIKKRIENLNQLYNTQEADITIEDLVNENGEPSGTRVSIVFPLQLLDKLSEKDYADHSGR